MTSASYTLNSDEEIEDQTGDSEATSREVVYEMTTSRSVSI